MTEICKCKKCGKGTAKIVAFDGVLFYAQCTNNCGKWNPYEFVGVSRKAAIRAWNMSNGKTPAPRNMIGLED